MREHARVLGAVGQAVLVGIVLVLAALPTLLITVVLATQRPPEVSRAFLAGWLLGLAVVAVIGITVVDVVDIGNASPRWLSWLKIVLGGLLLALAVRKWSSRPRDGRAPEIPKWMSAVNSLNTRKLFGLAFVLAAVNPKNVVIVLAAVTAVADATPRPGEQVVALLVFVVVGGLGVTAPALARRALGRRSGSVLTAVDTWMTRYSALIMFGVLLILGIVLIGNGIAGL